MSLLRRFPVVAFAVVVLGLVGFCVATTSVELLLVGGVLAALSWYVTEGPRGRFLPVWTANVLTIAVTLNLIVDFIAHRHDVTAVLGRFVFWLALIKLYQHKAPRDYAQLLSLSLLLMLIGCLRTTQLLFAATLLLYAILGLYALLLYQLHAAHERNRRARLAAIPRGDQLLPSLQPIVGRRSVLHFGTLAVSVAAAGMVTSAAFFVLFPRQIGLGWIAAGRRSGEPVTGYAEQIDLTGGTRITDSRKVALMLKLTGVRTPVDKPLLLRGAVLDRYEGGGRWRSMPHGQARVIETSPPAMTELAPVSGGVTMTQRFELFKPTRTLFSAQLPVAVATPHARRLSWEPATQTLHDDGRGRVYRYVVEARPQASDETWRAVTGALRPIDTAGLVRQFAAFDGRVRELARGVVTAAGLPIEPPADEAGRWRWNADAAAALTRFLHSRQFEYATDLRDVRLAGPAGAQDPIAHFLLDTRRGHCEYFASGLAAMCNTIGIPARLVAGYVAIEFDEPTRQYIVRESNAHAWVEVRTGEVRWSAFDPTRPGTLLDIHGGQATVTDRWRWIFDRFEARWSTSFVEFDQDSQARLIDALDTGWSHRLGRAIEGIGEWAARVNRAFYFGPAGYIWMGIVGLALLIAAIAVAMRLRRVSTLRATLRLEQIHGTSLHRMVRQLGFYLDMLHVLERHGRRKPRWQPPLLYARVLARKRDAGAPFVRELTELFYAARYGGRALEREELARAQKLVEKLGTVL